MGTPRGTLNILSPGATWAPDCGTHKGNPLGTQGPLTNLTHLFGTTWVADCRTHTENPFGTLGLPAGNLSFLPFFLLATSPQAPLTSSYGVWGPVQIKCLYCILNPGNVGRVPEKHRAKLTKSTVIRNLDPFAKIMTNTVPYSLVNIHIILVTSLHCAVRKHSYTTHLCIPCGNVIPTPPPNSTSVRSWV